MHVKLALYPFSKSLNLWQSMAFYGNALSLCKTCILKTCNPLLFCKLYVESWTQSFVLNYKIQHVFIYGRQVGRPTLAHILVHSPIFSVVYVVFITDLHSELFTLYLVAVFSSYCNLVLVLLLVIIVSAEILLLYRELSAP